MKMTFICTGKSEEASNVGRNMFSYKFTAKKVSDDPVTQGLFSDLIIKSFEPSHFKVGTEYTVLISDLLTLATGLNKAGTN